MDPERYLISDADRRGHSRGRAAWPSRDRGRHHDHAARSKPRAPAGAGNAPTVCGPGRAPQPLHSPGYAFRVVDGLLTNFHLPQSSLLMLVSAFAGPELEMAAYRTRSGVGFRFYSYGDAMLIL